MGKNNKWVPFSSAAYGANAVFIPEWGKKSAMEFILVMTQNYPDYKTHSVLDTYHGYVNGKERFESNYEYRIVGWEIDPKQKFWSFIYLPTSGNDVKAVAKFIPDENGNLSLNIEMVNPDPFEREWEFHLYCSTNEGLELPDLSIEQLDDKQCAFAFDGIDMTLFSEDLRFISIDECNSHMWINFPLNAEETVDPNHPGNRNKKRLLIKTFPISIPATTTRNATIDFSPSGNPVEHGNEPEIVQIGLENEQLPYLHQWWESLHNQQYINSCYSDRGMVNRVIPARQWAKFFIWDGGMTAIGVLEMDETFAEHIISEMPDPNQEDIDIFKFGSCIITAVYALWELYQKTGEMRLLEHHYKHLCDLLLAMYHSKIPPEKHDGMVRSVSGTGADDSPALFYANGFVFAWDYRKTLPTNPERVKKSFICSGLTSHAIRGLKIMRQVAWLLNKQQEVKKLSEFINNSETRLNQEYWDDNTKCYLDRLEEDDKLLPIPWIFGFLPLFSGSVDRDRQRILLDQLQKQYLSENGLIIVPRDSQYYRKDGYPNGSAWPPLQYFFWKTAYNLGEMDLARKLSDTFLSLFEQNHKETLCCWEQFRAESGNGAGNSRFSGFMTPILAIWKARRSYGRIQIGHDVIIIDKNLTENDSISLTLQSPFHKGKTGISVVLKPQKQYDVSIDGQKAHSVTSDKWGYLDFSFEIDHHNTFTVEIS